MRRATLAVVTGVLAWGLFAAGGYIGANAYATGSSYVAPLVASFVAALAGVLGGIVLHNALQKEAVA